MDFGFRAIWWALSPSNRLFLLFFGGVSLYTPWVSLRVVVGLGAFKKERASGVANVSGLSKRLANLRQLHLFTLYLLLLCIVVNIPGAFSTNGPSNRQISMNLGFLFNYYTAIFLVFILLHSVQWLVSARVEASSAELGGTLNS
jgi:hypothetical protein